MMSELLALQHICESVSRGDHSVRFHVALTLTGTDCLTAPPLSLHAPTALPSNASGKWRSASLAPRTACFAV